ncbi:YbaB/EbfC family nucleoid-associated protein [Nocardia sp. NPDC050793]|uniref:YbaB/EbfC family nucleoid-associated protein n=1 Tax=Nocardia sp. NPDC050793 TaxID=3155159 RepID=UPI0033DAEBED
MAADMDLGRAIEGFAQMAADMERKAQRFAELQGRMTALTATETGAGGRVSVTVDSSGVPTAIDLTPTVRDMDSRALAAEILSCMRRAQGKLRPGIAELVQDVVGDDPAGAALVDGFNRRFPEPETSAPTAQNFTPSQADHFPPSAANPPSAQQYSTPPAYVSAAPPEPRTRKPDRNQIVIPDEPDEDDEYFRRKSWLV